MVEVGCVVEVVLGVEGGVEVVVGVVGRGDVGVGVVL